MFSSARTFVTLNIFAFVLASALLTSAQTLPPNWIYSTYFGGSQGDTVTAATRDAAGNIYVTGTSASPNFPTTAGVYEPSYPGPSGDNAVFVAKFSAEGALVWSTFLGPGSSDFIVASGIAVDAGQNVYVTGIFQGARFPTTTGLPHGGSVFVTKINATGSAIVYSGLIAGSSILTSPSIVLDSSDDVFIAGSGPAGSCCESKQSGIIGTLGGIDDFWIAEINADGVGLPWSVQMGGNGQDEADGLAIDSENNLYVTGYTASSNFPVTAGALNQPGIGRTQIVKFDPRRPPAKSVIYSAVAGNPGNTQNNFLSGESIVVDGSGDAYVGAWTYNLGLYVSPSAFQIDPPEAPNAYVFELNPAGSAFLNGTYLGGSNADYVGQLALDNSGNVYVAGFTQSWDFPATAYTSPPESLAGMQAYYVELNPQFAAVSSVTFGVSGQAEGFASIADGAGGMWIAGYAGADFPTTANAFQPNYGGNYDGYLLHTDFAPSCSSGAGVAFCAILPDSASPELINFNAQASTGEGATSIGLNVDGMNIYGTRAAQLDAWLPIAPGNHVATVTAKDVGGSQYSDQQNFTVAQSTCPVNPVQFTVTLCSPLNAAVMQSPVAVQAVVSDFSLPNTLTLYVDGTLAGTMTGQNGTYTYSLQIGAGVHLIRVVGKDGFGDLLTTSAVMNVAK
jgi:Beta-propeller repeat